MAGCTAGPAGGGWRVEAVLPASSPDAMSPVVRVLLVDDQELIRAGLRGILRARFGFEIVGELGDGARGRRDAWPRRGPTWC